MKEEILQTLEIIKDPQSDLQKLVLRPRKGFYYMDRRRVKLYLLKQSQGKLEQASIQRAAPHLQNYS